MDVEGYIQFCSQIDEIQEDLQLLLPLLHPFTLVGSLHDPAVQADFAEPMPYLGALVCASPVDAAIHDAFGIANHIGAYDGCGPDFMAHDLSRYLGDGYRGRFIADFIRRDYAPTLPIFHLVGGLDKLRRSEKDASDPQDGLPVSLDEWIEQTRAAAS